MKAAKKNDQTTRVFSIGRAMPKLKQMMRKPLKPMRVIVVDDDENAVDGIVPILLNWPNIFSVTIIQKGDKYPDILEGRDDIVLLDDLLGKTPHQVTGEKITEWLREDGFIGAIASTSRDFNLPSLKYHFPHKYDIIRSFKAAGQFVLWLSQIIFEVECDQMDA